MTATGPDRHRPSLLLLARAMLAGRKLDDKDASDLVLAPAQTIPGAEVTPASDVYGLGATLYELLTGSPPLRPTPGERREDFVERVRHEVPQSPRQRAGVSWEIDRICTRCLRKDPAERYRSALDLAEDLR